MSALYLVVGAVLASGSGALAVLLRSMFGSSGSARFMWWWIDPTGERAATPFFQVVSGPREGASLSLSMLRRLGIPVPKYPPVDRWVESGAYFELNARKRLIGRFVDCKLAEIRGIIRG